MLLEGRAYPRPTAGILMPVFKVIVGICWAAIVVCVYTDVADPREPRRGRGSVDVFWGVGYQIPF